VASEGLEPPTKGL